VLGDRYKPKLTDVRLGTPQLNWRRLVRYLFFHFNISSRIIAIVEFDIVLVSSNPYEYCSVDIGIGFILIIYHDII